MTSSLHTGQVYEQFASMVRQLIPFDRLTIARVDEDAGTWTQAYVAGISNPGADQGASSPLRGSTTGQVVASKKGILASGAEREALLSRQERLMGSRHREFHSMIMAPLVANDRVVGVLNFRALALDAFTEREFHLAERLAGLIAGVVANADLHARVRRQSAESAAIAEIGRIARSTLRIEEVLERFAEQARRLIPHDRLVISVLNPQGTQLEDRYVSGADLPGYHAGGRHPVETSIAKDVLDEGRPLAMNREELEELGKLHPAQAAGLEAGFQSMLVVPLIWQDAPVGTLNFRCRLPDAYPPQIVQLADQVGAQIAGALATTNLYRQARREAEIQAALVTIASAANRNPALENIFQEVSNELGKLIAYDRLVISLRDPGDGTLRRVFVSGKELPDSPVGEVIPGPDDTGWSRRNVLSSNQQHPSSLKSWVEVPLGSEAEGPVGYLSLRSYQEDAYGEEDSDLLSRVALQITPAIQNARAHEAQRREAQQRAALAEIGRIISSSPRIEDIYERFAQQVRELVPFDRLVLALRDPQGRGTEDAFVTGVEVPGRPRGGRFAPSVSMRAIEKREPIVANEESFPRLVKEHPELQEDLNLGLRSLLIVPLRWGDEVIGTLNLRSKAPDPYGEDEVSVATQVGDQIAGAIANARLADELRRTSRENEVLAKIGRVITSSLDIEEVYEEFAHLAQGLIDFDRLNVTLVHPEAGTGENVYVAGMERFAVGPADTFPLRGSLTERVLTSGTGFVFSADDVDEFREAFPGSYGAIGTGMLSALAVPLHSEGDVMGALTFHAFRPNAYDENALEVGKHIADQIAGAIANAQLHASQNALHVAELERIERMQLAARRLALQEDMQVTFQNFVEITEDLMSAASAGLVVWARTGEVDRFYSTQSSQEDVFHRLDPDLTGAITRVREAETPVRRGPIEVSGAGERTFLGAPLHARGGRMAVLYVLRAADASPFTEDDERLLNLLGVLAGVFLNNAQLYSQMARERATLAAVQASMTDGLVVLGEGRHGRRVQYCNEVAAALGGFSANRVVGEPFAKLLALWDSTLESTLELRQSIESDSPRSLPHTCEVVRLAPSQRALLCTIFAIHVDASTTFIGIIMRDVTEERELDRRRNEFVATASHELRTPLAAIMGFSELLLDREVSGDKWRDWMGLIREKTELMTAIISDMLDVSRMQAGELEVNLAELISSECIQAGIDDFSGISEPHHLRVDVDPRLPNVVGDPQRIRQVLHNLLSNAVKYSPDGGSISAWAEVDAEGRQAIVHVRDQGVGIPPEEQQRLFTTFHRVRQPGMESVQGTGLGLHIVKNLVNAMGGDVWVESELGEGSTFSFSLPLAPGEAG